MRDKYCPPTRPDMLSFFLVVTHMQRHLATLVDNGSYTRPAAHAVSEDDNMDDRENRYFLRFGSIIRSKDRGIRYRAI